MLLGGGSGQEREKRRILSLKDMPCLGAATASARATPPRHTRRHSLLQQDRSACHQRDPPPVPDHDDQNAGGEEGFHGKPHFREASVLMDTLRRNEEQRDSWTGFNIIPLRLCLQGWQEMHTHGSV